MARLSGPTDLANISGDIAATVTLPATGNATGIDSYTTDDEYGNPQNGTAATGANQYGWNGTSQRATGGAGLTLMGARLYNPGTGRFTSVDPVIGGNENAYNYPNNPINASDITGLIAWGQWGLIEAGGWILGQAARIVACGITPIFCPLWTLAIGGIVGALKAGLIGILDHYSFWHMVRAMVAGFFTGVGLTIVFKILGKIGLRIVSSVGIKRLIRFTMIGLVSFLTARGSAALRRR